MSIASDEVYCLLVPLHQDRLIVPRSCVAEVIRDTLPESADPEDGWLRGTVNWNGRNVPVISFDRLCGVKGSTSSGGRTRIVIFNSISDSAESKPYGVLCEGFPQMVRVNAEVTELDPDYRIPENAPILCQVRLINEQALIPALDELETLIDAAQATRQMLDET